MESKNYEINDNREELTLEELVELWHSVGWTNGSIVQPERLLNALKYNSKVYMAWDNDKLIGLVSTVEDGFNAVITYMVVHSKYQNRGIGTELMKKFTEAFAGYRWYVQTTNGANFYKKFGFVEIMHAMSKTEL